MANLVLELKPGEMMVINGASIRFRTKSRIELLSRARFLFGKQIMTLDMAITPASRIYYALQIAYVGSDDERASAMQELERLLYRSRETAVSTATRLALETIERCALNDDYYTALKLGRRIMLDEEAMMQGLGGSD